MIQATAQARQSEILVTGGNGLLGTQLILSLSSKGFFPTAIYRNHIPAIVQDKAHWVQGDIRDVVFLNEMMQEMNYVYHVAGLVSFHKKDRQLLHSINVDGTANIVNACLKNGVKKLLHVSSIAAMGRHRPGQLVNETMWWSAEYSNSEYSRSKYLGEMEVWRGIGEGLNAVIINPSIIFGEWAGWETGSMSIFKNIYNGFKWYSNGGTGFVDALDVATIMTILMQADISGERFLVSAENKTYAELFFQIADALGVKRPHKKVNPLLAAIVWRLEKIRSMITGNIPSVTKETAKTSLTLVKVDNSKLLQAMPGFQYQPLEQSLARICTNLKKEYNLS